MASFARFDSSALVPEPTCLSPARHVCARAQDGVYTDCSCGNARGYSPNSAEWEGRQLAFDAALAMAKARSSPPHLRHNVVRVGLHACRISSSRLVLGGEH